MPSDNDIVCAGGTFHAFDSTFPIPDADITGIGVIIAFSAAAYISFFLGLIFYLLGYVPRDLLSNFEKQYIRDPEPPEAQLILVKGFQEAVLVVSEQQMVTALGVLGAALVKMQHYTVFEFQTIIYLAWMATNMHLSTLSILRTWFQSRPHLRAFRLFNMLALLVMMCIAIYPTTEYDWADHTVYDLGFCSSSHSCSGLTEKVDRHWQAARKQHRLVPQGVFAYAILIISHVWQSAMLFKKVHSSAHDRAQGLLKALGGALRPPIRNEPPEVSLRQIKYRLVIGIYMFFLAIIEILGSWAFVQFLVGTHLAWSSFQLFVPRFILLPSCVAAELNNWNFGQILPMLLLLSPLYSIVAYYFRHIDIKESENIAEHSVQTNNSSISPLNEFLLEKPAFKVHRMEQPEMARDKLEVMA